MTRSFDSKDVTSYNIYLFISK